MIKELFKDMTKYLPSNIVPAMVGLISIPIITRLFPPPDYGDYILVLSTIMVLCTLVSWVGMSIVRFYPAYERDKKLGIFYSTVIKWLLISVFGISVLFLVILLIGKSYISQNLYDLMLLSLGIFILSSFFGTLLSFLRVKRLVGWYTTFSVWKSITAIGFGLILVMIFKFGIEGLLWGIILAIVLVLPWLWRKVAGKTPLKGRTSRPLAIEMAKFSFPLMIGNLAYWILALSDRYVLGFFRGAREVGIYSASYGIGEKSILLLVSLFTLGCSPIAYNIWEKEGERKSRVFNTEVTRYFLMVSLPAVVGLSVLAKPILGILTGQEYFMGYRVLPFVALSIFLDGAVIGFGHGLGYRKKTKYIMMSLIIGGLVNLGFNFAFVPKYGYMAAATTTLIGFIVMDGLIIYFSKRLFTWKFPFKSLGKIGCASIMMGLLVYCLSNTLAFSNLINLAISIPVGIVIYVSMLFLLHELKTEEIKEVCALVSGIFKLGI